MKISNANEKKSVNYWLMIPKKI